MLNVTLMVCSQSRFIIMIPCYGLVVNVCVLINLLCLISLLLKKIFLIMCAKYGLVYDKELNMFKCFCRYFGSFHHCTRKIKGTISIVSCLDGCKLCEKELERKEYNSLRWKTNKDGYSVCVVHVLSGVIVEKCFCLSCYASISEKCLCFKYLTYVVSS